MKAFLVLSVLFFLSISSAKENNCYKVTTSHSGLNVRSSANGKICGGLGKGRLLFKAGNCVNGWCPISYKSKNCKGTGWVKEKSNSGKRYITACKQDPENLFNLPDVAVKKYSNRANCYKVTTPSGLRIRSKGSSFSKKCGSVINGGNLIPAGACKNLWCPVEINSKSCHGVGYVFRGKMRKRYLQPCKIETSSPKTRAVAAASISSTGSDKSFGGHADELGLGDASPPPQASKNVKVDDSPASKSLSFQSRCKGGNCAKSANRGYIVNKYNACKGSLTIGKSGGRCDSKILLNEQLKSALQGNFNFCAKQTAASLGIGKVKSVHIVTKGTFAYRPARGRRFFSQHAGGTAIDIKDFELKLENGSVRTISTHIRNYKRDGAFYRGFQSCWNKRGGSCSCNLSHNHGSKRIRGLHKDHLHLTYNCKRRGAC